MTPEEILKQYTPAFKDLFSHDELDLSRFLRLAYDVLNPPRYGPGLCNQCNETVFFEHTEKSFRCSNCKAEYPYAFYKPPKRAAGSVTITSQGGSRIGSLKSESDSGVSIVDR